MNPKPFGPHQRACVSAAAEKIGAALAVRDDMAVEWTVEALADLMGVRD